jgi:hypothetical protein
VLHLPSRCVGRDWQLLFSTDRDGYSLTTLYSRARGRGPTVVTVMDDKSHVMCGFASRDWSGSDLVTSTTGFSTLSRAASSYFGSGESFLARIRPEFAVYRWTRRDNNFLAARPDGLVFGGGGGRSFGLYLDAQLDHGSSSMCDTYGNAPLASSEMFRVVRVEVWGFGGYTGGGGGVGGSGGHVMSLVSGGAGSPASLSALGGGAGAGVGMSGGALGSAARNLLARLKRTGDVRGAGDNILV